MYFAFPENTRHQLEIGEVTLSGANGSKLEVYGKVRLTIAIEGVDYCIEAIEAELAGVQGILGMPFLSGYRCSIGLEEGRLTSCEDTHHLIKRDKYSGIELQVEQNVEIPIGQTAQVSVKSREPVPARQPLIWHPDTEITDRMGIIAIQEEVGRE